MKEILKNGELIPDNETGEAVDLESSKTENTVEEAITTFKRACNRILNPAVWHKLAGIASASFQIAPDKNDKTERLLILQDYVMIDIPGPGPSAGDGYDWVQVKEISENADPQSDENFGITLGAAANPNKPAEGAAHFFEQTATSTFIIKRNGTTITASYHGRNEKPNTKEVNFPDKIRNGLIATGALAGLSEIQWTALIKGFLEKEIGG
ncbi:hypothetical protein BH10BAC2_BH10BAC2_36240 [soil metagenome]